MEQQTENTVDLESYFFSVTDHFIYNFFSKEKEIISGKEILKLTPVKQINVFILERLFEEWEKEKNNLKSRFFDYDHPEVRSLLEKLANTLSHHIQVKQDDVATFLYDATVKTHELSKDFPTFIATHYFIKGETLLDKEAFLKRCKYVVENKDLLDASFENEDQLDKNVFLENLQRHYAKSDELFDKTNLLEALSKHVALPEKADTITTETDKKEEIEEKQPEEKETVEPETEKPQEEAASEKPASKKEEGNPSEKSDKTALHMRFQKQGTSLNDQLKSSPKKSLADELGKQKVNTLHSVISVNQRFIFMNELFEGNKKEYEEAIQNLENFSDYEAASNYLIDTFAQKYHWDQKEEETEQLFSLLSRKF